jgi:hypothetical protein
MRVEVLILVSEVNSTEPVDVAAVFDCARTEIDNGKARILLEPYIWPEGVSVEETPPGPDVGEWPIR